MASLHHPMLAYDGKDLNDDYARDVFFLNSSSLRKGVQVSGADKA